jgi:uncharacterized protein (DUF58 family)
VIPTGRLWAALCLLALPGVAGGFIGGIWAWIILLDAMLLAFAVVDYWAARRVEVVARRELPGKLSVGVPNRIGLQVSNRAARRAWVRIKDDVPEEFTAQPEEIRLLMEPASRATLVYRATPQKRGKFEFGDLNIRVRGPMGLMWH